MLSQRRWPSFRPRQAPPPACHVLWSLAVSCTGSGGAATRRPSCCPWLPAPALHNGMLRSSSVLRAPFLPQPPSYKLAQHGDGQHETYIEPVKGCGYALLLRSCLQYAAALEAPFAAGTAHLQAKHPHLHLASVLELLSTMLSSSLYGQRCPSPLCCRLLQAHQAHASCASVPAGIKEGDNSCGFHSGSRRRQRQQQPGQQPRQQQQESWQQRCRALDPSAQPWECSRPR